MRASNRLSAKGAAASGPGKYSDRAGLWLVKDEGSHGKWVLRVTVHGRRREMGLGAFPAVSLAEARKHADAARAQVRAGLDPIKEHQRQWREQPAIFISGCRIERAQAGEASDSDAGAGEV